MNGDSIPQTASRKRSTPDGQVVLKKSQSGLLSITLLTSTVVQLLYIFLSKGDEVSCGALSTTTVCFLPGESWLGYGLAVSFAFTAFSLTLLKPDKK